MVLGGSGRAVWSFKEVRLLQQLQTVVHWMTFCQPKTMLAEMAAHL